MTTLTAKIAKVSDIMRERISTDWPEIARSASTRALFAFDAVTDAANVGGKDTLRDRIASHAGKMLAKARRDLKSATGKFAADRAKLRDNAFRHETPRAVQISAEIRGHLRTLSQAERNALLMGPTADKSYQIAVLETGVPLALTGVQADMRTVIENEFLSKHFAQGVAELDAQDAALEHATASVELARSTMQREVGLAPHDFPAWFEKNCEPSAADNAAEERAAMNARQRADADRQAAIDRRLEELRVRSA